MHICSWHYNSRYDYGRVSMFDPSVRTVFSRHWLYYLRILAIYSAMLCCGLSVFFASTFRLSRYIHNIQLQIIDLDRGPVGRQITQLVLLHSTGGDSLLPQWVEPSPAVVVDSMAASIEFVRKHGWGAIVIAPGLSDKINDNADFDPRTALTVLASPGRNPRVVNRFVQPELEAMAQRVIQDFAIQHIIAMRTTTTAAAIQQLNKDVILPIAYTTRDVAPYSFGIASVAPIFALFVALACTLAAQVLVKLSSHELHASVRHLHLTLYLHALMLAWSLLLGLYGTLAIRAFLGPGYTNSRLGLPLTASRFFSEFAVLSAALLASSQWLFLSLTLLPPDLFPVPFLMLIAFSSVSAIVSIDLAPHAVRWLVVLPAHCHASLLRYIVSGAYPQLARDIGILLGEIVAMTIINSLAIAIRQYWLEAGIADNSGWFRTSIFFKPKQQSAASITSDLEEMSSGESSVSILHYTLYGH